MSAYILDKEAIDALVYAAQVYTRQYGLHWESGDHLKTYQHGVITTGRRNQKTYGWDTIETNDNGEDGLGGLLWSENQQSVATRYPEDTEGHWPGPVGLTTADVLAYAFAPPHRLPTPVEALKLLSCYEYQSCEHDGWKTSDAHQICESLRDVFITALPGYEQAEWGWTNHPTTTGATR